MSQRHDATNRGLEGIVTRKADMFPSSPQLSTSGSHATSVRAPEHEQPPVADRDRSSRMERLETVPLRFLRFATVRDRTGLSRSTIWRLERRGAFPPHRRISTNAVGWLEREVNEWVASRQKAG